MILQQIRYVILLAVHQMAADINLSGLLTAMFAATGTGFKALKFIQNDGKVIVQLESVLRAFTTEVDESE